MRVSGKHCAGLRGNAFVFMFLAAGLLPPALEGGGLHVVGLIERAKIVGVSVLWARSRCKKMYINQVYLRRWARELQSPADGTCE